MSKIKILNETLKAVSTSKKAGEYTELASGELSQEETIALVQGETHCALTCSLQTHTPDHFVAFFVASYVINSYTLEGCIH